MKEKKQSKKSTTAGKKRVTFRLDCEPGSKVFIAGTFNDWRPQAKAMKDKNGKGQFEVSALLPRGRHEYKFIVDDEWRVDPECPNWVQNEHGTLNSVIEV